MAELANRKATYEDLFGIPENMTGEIIEGELLVTPRPSRKHGYTSSALGGEVTSAYQFGRGGPGGWVFIIEPEIKFDDDILVPDVAGWKRERFPVEESHNWISAVPDWVAEVLSPGTAGRDKVKKMPIYARHGVPYCWLIDPLDETLDVFKLESNRWFLLSSFAENDKVRAEPFLEMELDLGNLWLR
jgi:Uma2 family endonuclease